MALLLSKGLRCLIMSSQGLSNVELISEGSKAGRGGLGGEWGGYGISPPPAEGGGDPAGAPEIAAGGQPGLPARQGRRGAPRGAAAGRAGVPGVDGGPEDGVVGLAPGCKLRGVGLGDNQGAIELEGPHERVTGFRYAVLVDRGPCSMHDRGTG